MLLAAKVFAFSDQRYITQKKLLVAQDHKMWMKCNHFLTRDTLQRAIFHVAARSLYHLQEGWSLQLRLWKQIIMKI